MRFKIINTDEKGFLEPQEFYDWLQKEPEISRSLEVAIAKHIWQPLNVGLVSVRMLNFL